MFIVNSFHNFLKIATSLSDKNLMSSAGKATGE